MGEEATAGGGEGEVRPRRVHGGEGAAASDDDDGVGDVSRRDVPLRHRRPPRLRSLRSPPGLVRSGARTRSYIRSGGFWAADGRIRVLRISISLRRGNFMFSFFVLMFLG